MKYFLKERNGDLRFFTVMGFKFSYNKRNWLRTPKKNTKSTFEAKCKAARIDPIYVPIFESIQNGDICIDCGCNEGRVSDVLLHKGAKVIGFEPHPELFELLSDKYKGCDQITLVQKAVWDRNTTMELYLQRVGKSKVINLEGTTLFGERVDASVETMCRVDVIDLVDYIQGLGKQVKILKIDVEGAEFEIIGKIIDTGVFRSVDHIFCEMHPHFFPDGDERVSAIKARLSALGIENIHLDWA